MADGQSEAAHELAPPELSLITPYPGSITLYLGDPLAYGRAQPPLPRLLDAVLPTGHPCDAHRQDDEQDDQGGQDQDNQQAQAEAVPCLASDSTRPTATSESLMPRSASFAAIARKPSHSSRQAQMRLIARCCSGTRTSWRPSAR